MKKTIGVFAHVDAGKTTFCEQLLYHTDVIRTLGRVDHQDAFLDSHAIEKRRGITIFSEQAHFEYKTNSYYLMDTPGHVDFSAEMERAIHIIDYAIIIVSGIDGVQSHTETVYELLKKAAKPIFFFVNKMDADHANYKQALLGIQKITCAAVDFMSKDYLELLAEKDDILMTYYFEENFNAPFTEQLKKTIQKQIVMPVFSGSSLKNEGIDSFLDAFDALTETHYTSGLQEGFVYKIRYDEKQVKQTFVKLTRGAVSVRDLLGDHKVTEIRKYQGKKYESIKTMVAGDSCALIGLELPVGSFIGSEAKLSYDVLPTLKSKVVYESHVNPKDLYQVFKKLEDEDPALKLYFEDQTKEITISVMGEIQLEVLAEVIKSRFNYQVSFEDPKVIYKETVLKSTIGYGHFEPLKHYAEVHLRIEPNPGRGIEVLNQCSADHLTTGHQNLIQHHLVEKEHKGILTGSGLTDLKITLLTGRGHNEHTSGGDFREATLRSLRQGLEQNENVLLEPIYEVVIQVPMELMGKVMTDIQQMKGSCTEQVPSGDDVIIKAHVPVVRFLQYPKTLASLSSGKGRVRMKVGHYAPCHNTEEVIEEVAYDKDTDTAYTSSSIFCSKGKGYTVQWQDVKDYMHCI